MSERGEEQATWPGLGTHPLDVGYLLSNPIVATRRPDRSQTGGYGRGDRNARSSARRDRWSEGDQKMSFQERFAHELRLIYEELLKTPPIILLVLSCLAVLLVGAIFIGATR